MYTHLKLSGHDSLQPGTSAWPVAEPPEQPSKDFLFQGAHTVDDINPALHTVRNAP